MKKIVRKVLSTTVAATMVMSTMGCSEALGSKSKSKSDVSDEDIEDIIADYMDNVIKGKSDKAMKLVEGDDNPYEDAQNYLSEDQLKVYEASLEYVTYEISKVSVDDNEATAKLTITVPSYEVDAASIDDLIDSLKDADAEEIKITVNLVGEDGDFLITEDSSTEIAESIIDPIADNPFAYVLTGAQTTEKYIQALVARDYEGAAGLTISGSASYSGTPDMEMIMDVYSAYCSNMNYTITTVSENGTTSVVKVTGTAPDINGAINSLNSSENIAALTAYYLESDAHGTNNNDATKFMCDTIIAFMNNNPTVSIDAEINLQSYWGGDYLILSASDLLPGISWSIYSLTEDQAKVAYQDGLQLLRNDGRFSQAEYDSYYSQLIGSSSIDGYKEEPVATNVVNTNDRDGKLIIFGFNDEFQGLVDTYSIGYDDFQITPNDGQAYTTLLDVVLADGEGAPDLFVCDADYVKKYIDDGRGNVRTKSINSLGISYAELSEMYNYTLKFAADNEGVIRGVTWQACPCGVFYNRTVAQATLGVSEPDDVAPYFKDWSSFLYTAQLVADAGDYRIVSGWDDVYRSYLNTRKTGWIVDGRVNIDPAVEDFFSMALALHENGLTWETSQWSGDWAANAVNEAVLSYWGPMWLGYSLGFNNPDSNPTSGDWGMVMAPTTWYWGGTWIMASNYSDKDADVAQIMRDIAINPSTLEAMNLKSGEFVNNISYMTKIASTDAGNVEWLGGQNPFGVLLETARSIDNSMIGIDDAKINEFFTDTVSSYINGGLDTPAEAENEFISAVQAEGLAN